MPKKGRVLPYSCTFGCGEFATRNAFELHILSQVHRSNVLKRHQGAEQI